MMHSASPGAKSAGSMTEKTHAAVPDRQPSSLKRTFPAPDKRFEPTLEAAMRRLERIRPGAYAKTRNFLDGAVTRLSPYLTHGVLTIPQCIEALSLRHTLTMEDKLVYEFAWREYFHHVWTRLGDGILSDIRHPVWRGRYQSTLPKDIETGCTGIAIIDDSIRELYRHGYLHNHARMWLASYVVHIRKVDWKVGAAWMYGYLLDGDLASNALSWQWVAGTFAHKPYLFNADNVTRYATGYDCRGTAIDQSYSDLEAIARGRSDCGPETGQHASVEAPPLAVNVSSLLAAHDLTVVDNDAVDAWLGRQDIHLVHPWDLGERRDAPTSKVIGWIDRDFHVRFPWSEQRWHFVLKRMRAVCDTVWVSNTQDWVQSPPKTHGLFYTHTLNPGYQALNEFAGAQTKPPARFFSNPQTLQPSFTRFFDLAMAGRELTVNNDAAMRQSA
jgi:deoxyribodipyrimidine photo-lyase